MDVDGRLSRRALLGSCGVAGALSLAGCLGRGDLDLPGILSVAWVSETAVEYDGNHHALAAATVDGEPVVALPRNDVAESPNCGLVAIDADGEVRWQDSLPREHCEVHAIDDVGVGELDVEELGVGDVDENVDGDVDGDVDMDVNGDGRPAFLTSTAAHGVSAYDPRDGEVLFRADRHESIGFSAPVVGDVTGDGREAVILVYGDGRVGALNYHESEVRRSKPGRVTGGVPRSYSFRVRFSPNSSGLAFQARTWTTAAVSRPVATTPIGTVTL